MKSQRLSRKKVRNSDEMEMTDRFSSLPNTIIHHILSLMDTKFAVQTCILSKLWKYHWTHIHSLNFDRKTFSRVADFRKFVLHVLYNREPLNLYRLKFYCRGGHSGKDNSCLVDRVFSYAKTLSLEELETDISSFPGSLCELTPTTLKLADCNIQNLPNYVYCFASVKTLHLCGVGLYGNHGDIRNLFNSFCNLENLFLIGCSVVCDKVHLHIYASQLVNLTISDSNFKHDGRTMRLFIDTPKLELFDFNGTYFLLLVKEKGPQLLDNMDSQVSNSTPIEIQQFFSEKISMIREIPDAKSLTVSLRLFKGKFVFDHYSPDQAETEDAISIKGIMSFLGLIMVGKVLDTIGFKQASGNSIRRKVV